MARPPAEARLVMRARRSPGSCFTIVCVLLAGMSVARPLLAQPFTLNEKIKPTELKLEPYRSGNSKTNGRIYGAVITQTQETQYFFVQGISIYSPSYVGITADNPSAPIQVSLHKAIWDRPALKGQTDSGGRWDAKFKTSGDFGISVTPDKLPATYAVLVWVGNEIDLPLVSPFKKSVGAPSSGRSWSTTIIIVAGLLILVIAAIVLRKSGIVRMCLLIGSLAIAPVFARAALAQEGGYPKAVADMLEQLKSFLEHQESVQDFWESLKALSSDEATPDVSQRGPTLPSSCLDASWKVSPEDKGLGATRYQDCQCMTTAVDKLRANRQMLEKLRILVANQKAFVDKATALGNSYAQLHTLLGLQWIGIKKHDIDEPYAQFKVISNQKHQQLMAAIEKDLKDIGACEARFGESDWYQKFGFIYYEFLYAAYKPSF
jgi:hypothetical protein